MLLEPGKTVMAGWIIRVSIPDRDSMLLEPQASEKLTVFSFRGAFATTCWDCSILESRMCKR